MMSLVLHCLMAILWERRGYTQQEFISAWNNAISIADVLVALDRVPRGGNYRSVRKAAESLGLTTEHMLGQASGSVKNRGTKTPTEEYLNNKQWVSSHKLRLRLLSEGRKEHRCESCGLSEWLNNPIPLELDHVDGDSDNNSLDNIKILCPNCHARTPTYRGKNRASARGRRQTAKSAGLKPASKERNLDVGSNPTAPTPKD